MGNNTALQSPANDDHDAQGEKDGLLDEGVRTDDRTSAVEGQVQSGSEAQDDGQTTLKQIDGPAEAQCAEASEDTRSTEEGELGTTDGRDAGTTKRPQDTAMSEEKKTGTPAQQDAATSPKDSTAYDENSARLQPQKAEAAPA
ncbi:hypothetical protein NX059_001758 [Plenodomus lindquistii]|nr:hypothetical protein NX059_001758 [Plenodomus lindquistii]